MIAFVKNHALCRPASLLADRDPNKAVLHSKVVIVDTEKVFLTSANLTEAAQTRNIELGVIFSNSSLARQIEEFFNICGNREYC